MEQEKNTLTVLEIAPGQYPKQVEIDPDLKALQQAVGGSIGASYPFADNPVAIVYNDDAKLMGLPLNRALGMKTEKCMMPLPGLFSWWVWARRILHRSPRSWRRSMKKNSINPKPFSLWGVA